MGVNTLRLYSFKTSIRHGAFLDALLLHNMSAIAAFEMGSASQTPLATNNDLLLAKARLRRQIKASKHPAIIMRLVGNELNGAWHLYVCDEVYAETYIQPTYGIDRCRFGSDAAALLRAVDELCSVAHQEGIPCSTPLADAELPSSLSSLPQYDGRGVLGWMKLMDGSTPEYTLRHIDAWSLNLYFGRNFTNRHLFELYEATAQPLAEKLPILVTEYGIDALDTDAWYEHCVTNASCSADSSLVDMSAYVDEGMQADWMLSLVEDLERNSVTCTSGCVSHAVSGGTVMAWVDEAWKGRVIDSVASDARTAALSFDLF